jgi:dienelactone hydrolase
MAQKNIIKRIISSPLVQTFLIYVSGGWIALEITDYIINNYGLGDKIRDVLSIILLIGLPIALLLSWYLGREKEEGEETDQEELRQRSIGNQKDQIRRISYPTKRPQIIFSGILIIMAIAITVIFRMHHQSKIEWAREVALPRIEEIANDMTVEGYQSWIAFDLASEASKYIPDDPLLVRSEQHISWTVKFYSKPSEALVFIKPYDDVNADWRFLGETPLESIRLPRGLSKIKIEKEDSRTVYDLIWKHWSFNGNSLYYLLPESGSIPDEMVMLTDTSSRYNRISYLQIPGMGRIENEKTGDFLMDRFEVTNADYKRFVDGGGYKNLEYWKYPFVKEGELLSREEAIALFIDKTGRTGPATWQIGDFPDGEDDYPVSGVSWYEAAAYAESLGKSLPTIFHWSRAAHPAASGIIIPMSNINKEHPLPVGASQSMNRFGIYDLAGNVREWCFNMSERENLRFILGGGWNDPGFSFNVPYAQSPFDRSETNGFRCIAYLESDENRMALEKPFVQPIPDFLNKPKVADEIFAVFKKQYLYDKTDLNSVIEEVVESDDYIKEKITFDAAYGDERMMAYLYLPKTGIGPYQTVIFFPGSGVIRTPSSEQINVDEMFVKSGRALLYPIYKSTFERGDDLTSDRPTETSFYKEHVIMWVKDLSRSIDYLETRSDIDTGKLAYFGFSWGGAMGAIIPAIEERIKTCVLLVAGLFFQPSLPEVDPVHYLPRITIPMLMLNGKYDSFFPYETSQLPFYQLLGTPKEDKDIFLYEHGHYVPKTQLAKETLAWLDQYLGPVNE